jgi:hypothetical protein
MAPYSGGETEQEASRPLETLSQFVARVLDQLSLSAWLPSAALVLSLDFIAQLGAVLDAGKLRGLAAVGAAFTGIGRIGFGGSVVLAITVVVLTMLTQAFSLEAIRLLEGYWGTWGVLERLARWRCERHRQTLKRLNRELNELNEEIWIDTRAAISRIRRRERRSGRTDPFTKDMVSVICESITGKPAKEATLTAEERAFLRSSFDWRDYAPAEPMRRRVNVERRIRDYPPDNRILPTRLGNILRAHEDQTGISQVRTFIQDVFDTLPVSMRAEHDEQRTRLDLYCSMVFVLGFAELLATARLAAHHLPYAVTAIAIAVIGMFAMYRAALASARAYGSLLVTIARFREKSQGPSG